LFLPSLLTEFFEEGSKIKRPIAKINREGTGKMIPFIEQRSSRML